MKVIIGLDFKYFLLKGIEIKIKNNFLWVIEIEKMIIYWYEINN